MIRFTDRKLFVKGTCQAIVTDKGSGDILYYSDKFQTGNITTSVTMGEIRGGLGNAVAAIIPSDSALNVDFVAADFSLWAKAAQLGASVKYSAPVMVCQDITANGEALTIDVAAGTPVAQLGFGLAYAYVLEVDKAAPVMQYGTAYPIGEDGAITGFTATTGTEYKVWYYINKPTAQVAAISSMFDPKVVHFTAQIAVYANESGNANEGTRVGWLYVIVPSLKFGANGGVVGDVTTADTTSLSGQAIVYDAEVIGEGCESCGGSGNAFAYYVYVPDDATANIQGLAIIGGNVEVPVSGTAQVPVKLVMADGSLADPASYTNGFTYTLGEGGPAGTTVSPAGLITAGATAGDTDVTVVYTDGETNYTVKADVEVVAGE